MNNLGPAVALSLALGALLVLAFGGLAWLWLAAGVQISLFGWIAIGVGALVSILLGVGLMALSFYSARAGYDDLQVPPSADSDGPTP